MTKPATQLITREELKEKLDREDDFKLVMALGDWHFRAAHIPGSISVSSRMEAAKCLEEFLEVTEQAPKPPIGGVLFQRAPSD